MDIPEKNLISDASMKSLSDIKTREDIRQLTLFDIQNIAKQDREGEKQTGYRGRR